jgi:hypothetical protein
VGEVDDSAIASGRERVIALLGIGAVIRILARGNPGVVAPTINQPAIGTRISIGYRNLQLTSWFNLDLKPTY